MKTDTDVVVIGGGPVGLFSLFELGMLKLNAHLVDALDMVGGQCSALYPEKPIYDIPAHPMITGQALVDNLYQQALPFNTTFHMGQQVIILENRNDHWFVKTSQGTEITTKCVLIAAGVGAFGPNRPPMDNIELFENKSVLYYIKNRSQFENKRVVIAGGGDSAVDWALSLCEIASKVSVVHRRPKFRAAPDSEAKLNQLAKDGIIDLIIPYQLKSLVGENGQITHVNVETLEGDVKSIEADYLLPFFGLSMNLGPIAEWGLGLDKNHITIDQSTCATNAPGIYAIGDIATYPNKLKLILTGFAEAAQAAHSMRSYIYPGEVVHFEYSTTKGVPGSK
jgi:thioredoxin reductase (NADPH)